MDRLLRLLEGWFVRARVAGEDLYDDVNWAVRRRVIPILVVYHAVLGFVAWAGVPGLTASLGLIPLGAAMYVFVYATPPMLWPLLWGAGRIGEQVVLVGGVSGAATNALVKGLRAVALLIGVELAMTLYFSVVPVHHDPAMIPVILLAGATLFALSLALRNVLAGLGMIMAVAVIAALTGMFFWGGREEIAKSWQKATAPQPAQSPPPPAFLVREETATDVYLRLPSSSPGATSSETLPTKWIHITVDGGGWADVPKAGGTTFIPSGGAPIPIKAGEWCRLPVDKPFRLEGAGTVDIILSRRR